MGYFGLTVPFKLQDLVIIELLLMAAVEARRLNETNLEKKLYPGFDLIGVTKVKKISMDSKKFETMKIKEIKNGRLAMISFLGFIAQHAATREFYILNIILSI